MTKIVPTQDQLNEVQGVENTVGTFNLPIDLDLDLRQSDGGTGTVYGTTDPNIDLSMANVSWVRSLMSSNTIAPWDVNDTYATGALVRDPADAVRIFISLIDNNTGNALPTGTESDDNWAHINAVGATLDDIRPFARADQDVQVPDARIVSTIARVSQIPTPYSNTNTDGFVQANDITISGNTLTLPDGSTYTISTNADGDLVLPGGTVVQLVDEQEIVDERNARIAGDNTNNTAITTLRTDVNNIRDNLQMQINNLPDDNTTYTFTGNGNGSFTVTPSGGSAQVVNVGLTPISFSFTAQNNAGDHADTITLTINGQTQTVTLPEQAGPPTVSTSFDAATRELTITVDGQTARATIPETAPTVSSAFNNSSRQLTITVDGVTTHATIPETVIPDTTVSTVFQNSTRQLTTTVNGESSVVTIPDGGGSGGGSDITHDGDPNDIITNIQGGTFSGGTLTLPTSSGPGQSSLPVLQQAIQHVKLANAVSQVMEENGNPSEFTLLNGTDTITQSFTFDDSGNPQLFQFTSPAIEALAERNGAPVGQRDLERTFTFAPGAAIPTSVWTFGSGSTLAFSFDRIRGVFSETRDLQDVASITDRGEFNITAGYNIDSRGQVTEA